MLINLPIDTINIIITFIELKEIYHVMISNKSDLNKMIYPIFEKKIKMKREFVRNNFPNIIIDTMGGMKNMIFLPILKYKPKFMGSTHYIDKILPSDVNEPIMIGVDVYKRGFITFRLKKNKNIWVETFFQRYSDITISSSSWTWGGKENNQITNYNGSYWSNYTNGFSSSIKINDCFLKENITLLLKNEGYIKKRSSYMDHYGPFSNYVIYNVECI